MPRVSILLRTKDAGARFSEVLDAIAAQSFADREVVVVDSGSRDRTLELAASHGARIVHLEPQRFTHAVSTNLGFESSRGAFVVSLSQDATPADPEWLSRLVDAVEPPDVAAAFGRQLPRPGCFPVEKIELARCYPDRPDRPGRALFSNVNSIVKRDVWRRRGFDESLAIAEDQEWARWAQSDGHRIVYDPRAAVWHSHDYSLGEIYARCRNEGRALATFAGFNPGIGSVLIGWPRVAMSDCRALRDSGELIQWPRACLVRLAQLLGNYRGARQAS